MENKKTLKVILIIGSIFVAFCLIFIAGFWLYRAKFVATELANDYYGGVGFDSKLSGKGSPQAMAPMYEGSNSNGGEYDFSSEERSIIRTGDIEIAVDDIDITLDSITDIRNEYGASMTNLNDNGQGKSRVASLIIRVEESKFEEIYNKLKDLDGEFESSSISESDVTDTVVDLQARLKNYQGVEAQFLSILETAKSVEDTLSVYRELNAVRLNIEMIQAQLENIGKQTEYSYIYVNISQSSTGLDVSEEAWRPLGVFKDAIRSLVSFVKFFGSALIWVVVFVPVIALVVVPVVLIQKRVKK